MTRGLRAFAIVVALGAILGSAAAGVGQERVTHSGTVVAIDDVAGTIVVAEVGSWKLRDGQPVITYRTITLTPDTEVMIAGRTYDTADPWDGPFIEGPLGRDALYLNDPVTVDCLHVGTRLIALKITITAPQE
jgi:hypothetical protein